jgi:hypothetical protein
VVTVLRKSVTTVRSGSSSFIYAADVLDRSRTVPVPGKKRRKAVPE